MALRLELSHVPQALTEFAEAGQVRKTNRTGVLYQIQQKGPNIDSHALQF